MWIGIQFCWLHPKFQMGHFHWSYPYLDFSPNYAPPTSSISHPPWFILILDLPLSIDPPTRHTNSHRYFFHVSPLPAALHRLPSSPVWTTAIVSCCYGFFMSRCEQYHSSSIQQWNTCSSFKFFLRFTSSTITFLQVGSWFSPQSFSTS